MEKRFPFLIGLIIILVLIGSQSIFIVNQTEKALVIQLGDPVDKVFGPGLHFKIPLIQTVVRFDARVLDYEARAAEALTSDKKAIVLDNYARWRIIDPLQFYRSVRTIPGAQARLDDVVYSQLRAQVGRHSLTEVVSSKRSGFGRMRAERERQAKQYRSEGVEEATKLRSEADRERAVILAEANRRSSVIRGEGDATAARVFAEAFSRAPDFYKFQRGLEALKKGFEQNSRIVITNDDPFLAPIR